MSYGISANGFEILKLVLGIKKSQFSWAGGNRLGLNVLVDVDRSQGATSSGIVLDVVALIWRPLSFVRVRDRVCHGVVSGMLGREALREEEPVSQGFQFVGVCRIKYWSIPHQGCDVNRTLETVCLVLSLRSHANGLEDISDLQGASPNTDHFAVTW